LIVLFEVHPGPTIVVFMDGKEVARKRLRFPEVRKLLTDILRHTHD